jgi:hypothetical protein
MSCHVATATCAGSIEMVVLPAGGSLAWTEVHMNTRVPVSWRVYVGTVPYRTVRVGVVLLVVARGRSLQ